MNSDFLKYKADSRKYREELLFNNKLLKEGSDKIELHHHIGRKNSKITIPLCKSCHDFITNKQNSLSVKERKNPLIFALKSIHAIFHLGCELLGFIIEELINNDN